MGPTNREQMELGMQKQVLAEVEGEDPNLGLRQEKTIFIVSDGSGTMAEQLISRLLVQFRTTSPQTRLRGNIRTAEQMESVIAEVSAVRDTALIFATIVDPDLLGVFHEFGKKMGVKYIDVMSPLLAGVVDHVESESRGVPGGALYAPPSEGEMNIAYFRRVKAVEFVQQHLMGLNQKDWRDADCLLIGLSRVGKISLAFFLAQYGVKAACMDIKAEGALPTELLELDPKKVVVMEIQRNIMARRRQARVREMSRTRMPQRLFEPGYADLTRIQAETDYLARLVKQNPGWLGPVDLTHHALEESASKVMDLLQKAQGM